MLEVYREKDRISRRSSLFLHIYIIKQRGQAGKQAFMVTIGGVISELGTLGGEMGRSGAGLI